MPTHPHTRRPRASSTVVVEASLDDLTSADVRFLEEAARLGALHVRIPSDALVERRTGRPPKFPIAERRFLGSSLRSVTSVGEVERDLAYALPRLDPAIRTVAARAEDADPVLRAACAAHGIAYVTIPPEARTGFPLSADEDAVPSGRPRVVVTGCYDWLHSGHVRFFMDAAALGELYVIAGSDANVELLKGPGHPLQDEDERRYMVGAVRVVHRALISSGSGWMDAEPEIAVIHPRFYVVNEDGDQPEKRAFCREHGIEYVVLRRRPHRKLPARASTDFRGF